MKKYTISTLAAAVLSLCAYAQNPLYIVNGVEMDNIRNIPPDDIEQINPLPADDETVAIYGTKANNGVIIVTLRYDVPASFGTDGTTFDDYIASQITWSDNDPAACVILRYTIPVDGKAIIDKELESTDSRFRRKVLKAFEDAPAWSPATKNGIPVESKRVLRVQLPVGKAMPRPIEIVYR